MEKEASKVPSLLQMIASSYKRIIAQKLMGTEHKVAIASGHFLMVKAYFVLTI